MKQSLTQIFTEVLETFGFTVHLRRKPLPLGEEWEAMAVKESGERHLKVADTPEKALVAIIVDAGLTSQDQEVRKAFQEAILKRFPLKPIMPADTSFALLAADAHNPRIRRLVLSGIIFASAGDAKTALDFFRSARNASESPILLTAEAWCLLALGQYEEAIQVSRKALELYPFVPETMLAIAEAHHCLGNTAEAYQWLERARTQAPDNFTAKYLAAKWKKRSRNKKHLN